jgi:tetratricopeptide (TPR) repeat protein
MPRSLHALFALLLIGACPWTVHSQPAELGERALPLQTKPDTVQERNRLEALKLYGQALLSERGNRLLEAVRSLEQARELDPESKAIVKALVPLYLALDRGEDALAACQRVLELDKEDFDAWLLLARQLKGLGRLAECRDALARGIACRGLKDRPEIRLQMCFDLGVLCEEADLFEKAEEAYRQAASVLEDPNALLEPLALTREEVDAQASEVYERLGKICLRTKHFDRARNYFVQAQTKAEVSDPSRARRLSFNLAQLYAEQGNYKDALARVEDYLGTQPEGVEAYQLKIDILRKLGRGREVFAFLERCIEHDGNNEALQLLLANEYKNVGERAKAEKQYLELARRSPTPDVYRELVGLWKQEGPVGLDKFLDLLDGTLGQARNNPMADEGPRDSVHGRSLLIAVHDDKDLLERLKPVVQGRLVNRGKGLQPESRLFLAVLASRTGKLDLAEEIFETCLKDLQGQEHHFGSRETDIYAGLLRVLWQGHKYSRIVEVCRYGLDHAQKTNFLLFHIDLARALVLLGQPDEALLHANTAVDLAQDDNRLYCRHVRVSVLTQAERYDQAIVECQAMLRDYYLPQDVHEIRMVLSTAYSQRNDLPSAEEQLQLILQDEPDDATANNDLGYLWADHGKNLAEAEKMIRKALELDRAAKDKNKGVAADGDQDNAAYLDSLGWVLFRREKLAEARAELEKAVTLVNGEDDPVVWDHLGDVYQRMNENGKARAAWKKSVELYEGAHTRPKDDRYKEVIRKLKVTEQLSQ